MARDTETRRAELREKLIDLAEAEIARAGIAALRARTIAGQAGCAVGAIYNVFEDMPHLVLAVNMRTFVRLGTAVTRAVEGLEDAPPIERLIAMAHAYADFASAEHRLWRALFDIEFTAGENAPDWYVEYLDRVFEIIARPFAELDPDAEPDEIQLRARTMFSAIHGITQLSLERRLSGVPAEQMKPMIAELLRRANRT